MLIVVLGFKSIGAQPKAAKRQDVLESCLSGMTATFLGVPLLWISKERVQNLFDVFLVFNLPTSNSLLRTSFCSFASKTLTLNHAFQL